MIEWVLIIGLGSLIGQPIIVTGIRSEQDCWALARHHMGRIDPAEAKYMAAYCVIAQR